jgi:transcriptional antiterminator NusG
MDTQKEKGIKFRWYAVRTVAGKEVSAKENIEREIEMNGLGKWVNQVILPREKQYKIKSGKKVTREKNTFPGYLFIELSLVGEIERTVKNTKNVVGFTGDRANKPIPLKQTEIDRIIGKIEKQEEQLEEIPFIVGEKVNVIDGPFNGFDGEVDKGDHVNIDEDEGKLTFARG